MNGLNTTSRTHWSLTSAFRLVLLSSAFFAPFSLLSSTDSSFPDFTARGFGPQFLSGFICQRTSPWTRDGGLASGCGSKQQSSCGGFERIAFAAEPSCSLLSLTGWLRTQQRIMSYKDKQLPQKTDIFSFVMCRMSKMTCKPVTRRPGNFEAGKSSQCESFMLSNSPPFCISKNLNKNTKMAMKSPFV